MRLSTTLRMALLAIGLALVSGLVPVVFLWHATHDNAIDELRRDTVEQSDALVAVYRASGAAALRDAIERARVADDGSLVAEVVDAAGRRRFGVGPDHVMVDRTGHGFVIQRIAAGQAWGEREAGVIVRPIGGMWLVSGRLLDDWEAAQRSIERALVLSALVSLVLGIGGGALLTRYVTRRIDAVAQTADAIAAGDLAQRVAVPARPGDAFDRLGTRVNAMLDRIQHLMDELRIVSDSLAHDLRSPIARLRARAEAALTAGDGAARDAALGGLIAETEIVTRMLGVMMEISRSESGGRSGFVAIAPAEVLAAIADLYEPLAEEAGVVLTTAIEADVAPLPLHRELLSQAIANLVDNGLRHAAAGGAITLRLRADGATVRIAVADRGPGIAPEDHAEARRRFGRLDPARSKPGAGLGLALVDAVAHLHGGRVELGDNAPGLVAEIVIPRA